MWIVVLMMSLVSNLLCQQSDGSWHTWEAGGRQYFISWGRTSWNSARSSCGNMDGDLLVISSEEENTFLENVDQRDREYWIGLLLTCTDSSCHDFRWENGETDNFAYWESGYPRSNSGYNYVTKYFRTGGWKNYWSTSDWPYVCEFTDACSSGPCSVNERCISQPQRSHTCVAIVPTNECDSNPCVNGECLDTPGNYSCSCESGYEGRNGQIDINECHNGHRCVIGSCENINGGYRCICPNGYYGEYCQYDMDECELHSCLHGRCLDGSGSYKCACDSGFTGMDCEQDIDECQISKICHHGECTNTAGGYKCECSDPYHGKNCNIGPSVSSTTAITAAIFALFATISLAVAIIFAIWCWRKHKNSKNTPTVAFDARRNDYVVFQPNNAENSEQAQNHGFDNINEQTVYENAPKQETYTSLSKR